MGFLMRTLVTAAALWVAVTFVPGLSYEGHWAGLLGVALVFGVVNAIIRPILFLLTCPLVLATLGLFVLVLNGIMLWLTAALSESLGIAFSVSGAIPAVLGALVVSVVSTVLSVFVGKKDERKSRDD
jgi:putative membrane protein